jgi:CIC family chloride channel protein
LRFEWARRHLPQGRVPRMLGAAILVGIVVGLLVAVFEQVTVEWLLEELATRPLWQQALAPIIGLTLSSVILRVVGGRGTTNSTSDEYIKAFHDRHPKLPWRHLPAKLMAGAATIGFGGAVGLEGPSIYAGSSTGFHVQNRIARLLRRDEQKVLLVAGAAAGVAAIFKAPATGVLFAMEAPYRDDVTRRALLPALLAAAASYLTFITLLDDRTAVFPVLGRTQDPLEAWDLLGGALVGLAAGLGGRGFAYLVRHAKEANRFGQHWRIIIGGAVLAGLALGSDAIFDSPLTLGFGRDATDWVFEEEQAIGLLAVLFLFRMTATLVTVGAGGTGGLFIPLAVLGVIMGALIGEVVGQADTTLYPTLGLAAFLGAGYRVPIAAVMFVAESSRGSPFVVPALIAAAVSQLVAGNSSVSNFQQSQRLGHLERRFTLPISSALTTDVFTVPPDATIAEFVYVHALGRRERTVPVVDGSTYVGLCGLDMLGDLDRSEWEDTTVVEVMVSDAPAASPSWTLRDAVAAMEEADVELLPVVDDSQTFIGVVVADDILKLDEILDETGG